MPIWRSVRSTLHLSPHLILVSKKVLAMLISFSKEIQVILRATKTGPIFFTNLLILLILESWVRSDSVGTCPEKFSKWKFSGTERFTNKFCFRGYLPRKNESFQVQSDLRTSSVFHWPPKKVFVCVPTIMMSPTFPIASLSRYTPKFSGRA